MTHDPVKNRRQRKARRFYRRLAVIVAALFAGMLILALVLPDKELSVREKRVLASFPKPYLNRVAEGDYGSDLETYVSDQIPFRNFFTDVKVYTDLLAGKRESQGVFRARDGYLIEKMEEPDVDRAGRTLSDMADFAQKYEKDAVFVLVPTAALLEHEKLPPFASTASQADFSARISECLKNTKIRCLDVGKTLLTLKEKGTQLYYRTDHHWTTEAALGCAGEILTVLGRDFNDKGKCLPVTENFTGSLAAKSGLPVKERDVIKVWAPDEEPLCLVTDSKGKHASLYSEEGLKSEDPYTVFLGGNEGFVRVETEQFGQGSLLVFKDSYFNCFLPFLLDSYEKIDVVDPRYYDGDIESLMLENSYGQVLFFYNTNTFAEDTSLSLVLGGSEN